LEQATVSLVPLAGGQVRELTLPPTVQRAHIGAFDGFLG
jgi:hypothetical protein